MRNSGNVVLLNHQIINSLNVNDGLHTYQIFKIVLAHANQTDKYTFMYKIRARIYIQLRSQNCMDWLDQRFRCPSRFYQFCLPPERHFYFFVHFERICDQWKLFLYLYFYGCCFIWIHCNRYNVIIVEN